MRKVLEEERDEESLSVLPKAVDTVRKKVRFDSNKETELWELLELLFS